MTRRRSARHAGGRAWSCWPPPAALGLQGGRERVGRRGYEPAQARGGQGHDDDLKRVTFTEEGAARTGLETATVRRSGGRTRSSPTRR